MNRFPKYVLIVLALSLSSEIQSQFRMGIRGGYNIAKIHVNESPLFNNEFESRTTFQAGLMAELPAFEKFYLQSGILYLEKGYRIEDESNSTNSRVISSAKGRYHFIEVPFNLAFKYSGFQIFAGPYMALGFAGKEETVQTIIFDSGRESETNRDEFNFRPVFGEVDFNNFNDDTPFSGLDYGINVGVGYEVGPLSLNASYSIGLGNILPNIIGFNDEIKLTHRVASLSLTYFFASINMDMKEEPE